MSRGEDEARITEKSNLMLAVSSMMLDSEIGDIPNPIFGSANATNDMNLFPDILSDNILDTNADGIKDKIVDPGGDDYNYAAGDIKGYRLWNHDNTADGSATALERYVASQYTAYYYSIDEDGTLHQYDAPGGTEYTD